MSFDPSLKKSYLDKARLYTEQSLVFPEKERELLDRADFFVQKVKEGEVKDEVKELKRKFSDFVLMKKPERRFKDVGGLEKVKENIFLKIIEPLRRPEIFRHFGKKVGGGILMYGPPGCGKTLIAEATAGECNATFFNVKASDIKSKYVGETERNLAKLFKEAREHQPSVIFFDEFETLGTERGGATGYDRAMVSQLLAETDGLNNKGQQILLIAATNEPWTVDLALRRQGRFGTSIFVPPPDLETREEILKILLRDKPLDQEVGVRDLALLTEGCSGAELEELVGKAVEQAIKDCLQRNVLRQLNLADFKKALEQKNLISGAWFKKAFTWIEANKEQEYFKELVEYKKEIIA